MFGGGSIGCSSADQTTAIAGQAIGPEGEWSVLHNVTISTCVCVLQLTDQEAAADEAIERLCLRCHNLETRLAEAQSASSTSSASLDVVGGETPTPPDGSRCGGRLSPVLEQGEETEEENEKDKDKPTTKAVATGTASEDMQSKYAALLTLYESTLQRFVKAQ